MFRRWLVALVLCAAAASLSIIYVDRTIADWAHQHEVLENILRSGPIQLPILQGVAVVLLFAGGLGAKPSSEIRGSAWVALQAGIAMACAMSLNIFLLKPAFGRTVPWLYFAHNQYAFHPFHASTLLGSFPSGHAVLVAALLSVIWILFPKVRPICIVAASGISAALILGEYHFFSDLIAGGFVGATVGILTVKSTNALIVRERVASYDVLDAGVRRFIETLLGVAPRGTPTIKVEASAPLQRHRS